MKLGELRKKRMVSTIAFLAVTATIFFTLNHFFKPGEISWEEFPYFENTFERTGFLPRTIQGTKYYFRGNYDLYKNWDLIAKVLVATTVSGIILFRKKLFNIYSIFIAGYLVLMVFTAIFFDRYILQLIPFLILFLLTVFDIKESRSFKVISTIFAIFLIAFSMQLATDFVSVQSYIWGKSEKLTESGIKRSGIYASGAWKRAYGLSPNFKYYFSFDSPAINPSLQSDFNLVETHLIEYPGNLFVNPIVYFYERR
ncbi:hypothetical protein HGB13_05195 [bacterium]|nr:hypothetical protein [bacterium]